MNNRVGLWIDHRKALIVSATGHEVGARLTISATERHPSRSGAAPRKGAFDDYQVPADGVRLRAFQNHLNAFYDAVIAGLAQADEIVVLGPGEAKKELMKRLEKRHLAKRVFAVLTADKMTNRQLVARIKKAFAA
jgi:hypothetical protein